MNMRNFIQIVEQSLLCEGRYEEVHAFEGMVRACINPTPLQLAGMLKRSKYGILRAMLQGDELICWDAAAAIHDTFGGGERLSLTKDAVYAYLDEDDDGGDFRSIAQHKRIVAAYRGEPPVLDYHQHPSMHIG